MEVVTELIVVKGKWATRWCFDMGCGEKRWIDMKGILGCVEKRCRAETPQQLPVRRCRVSSCHKHMVIVKQWLMRFKDPSRVLKSGG